MVSSNKVWFNKKARRFQVGGLCLISEIDQYAAERQR